MPARILEGDVFDRLPELEEGSVDVCVTSPPYWALRSYLPQDHALKSRELGSEATPDAYVARMVKVFRLVRRALADHAVAFVNIGDTYSADGCLALIPQRLALALQADGWICRSMIVWHKPAPMPASLAGWRWARHRVKVKEGGRHERPLDGTGWAPTADGNGRPGGGGGNNLATTSIG